MPSTAVKERLAQDLALWQVDGVIDEATRRTLAERYRAPGFGLTTLVKYLGVAGGLLAGFGVLGTIAAMTGSALFGSVLALGVASFFLWAGLRLSLDPQARYVQSSKVVLALGVISLVGSLAALATAFGVGSGPATFLVGTVVMPVAVALAYRFQNGFLLLLSVMGFFHWVGSWNAMLGRNGYGVEVQDPRVMAVVAAAVVAFGVVHEQRWQSRGLRFHQVYQTLGLVYLNLSLLMLSIERDDAVLWVVVLAVAAVGQLVLGARLGSGLLMGFGVTSMAVNLFTRYFERFWNRLEAGAFFLLGGLLLFGLGLGLEWLARRLPREDAS